MPKKQPSDKKPAKAVSAPAPTLALALPGDLTLSFGDNPGAPEAATLTALFGRAEQAQMQLLGLGLYAFGIKSRVPHGGFGIWLRDHAPDLARKKGNAWEATSALHSYMQLTTSVLEALGIQLTEWFPTLDPAKRKAGASANLGWEPHQLMLFPESELDAAQKIMRGRVAALIGGHSKRALIAKFVTYKEDTDANGDTRLVATTGAGKFHATKADGSARAAKRTFEQKQADEAAAAAAGLRATLMLWNTADKRAQLKLIPAALRNELKAYAADFVNHINTLA